jgi:hypothetical protein
MNQLLTKQQLIELAEYMSMRLTDKQAEMWMDDFIKEGITFNDFQFFSNYWRKNKDTGFKPKDVLQFMNGIKAMVYKEHKYCEKCNHIGFIFIDDPILPNYRYSYTCTCNKSRIAETMKSIDDYYSKHNNELFMLGVIPFLKIEDGGFLRVKKEEA